MKSNKKKRMKLVYIYGPPGVGKYTVGKELSKITGYKLFHNQLSIEFVMQVFGFGTKPFNRLVIRFRAEIIEEAAREGISLIFTSAYAKGVNDAIIKDIINRVEKHGGEVCFVQLFCEKKALLKRVSGSSRKKYYKIRSAGFLRSLLSKYNHFSAVPFRNNISIDNTHISPKEAAKMIAEGFRLGAG